MSVSFICICMCGADYEFLIQFCGLGILYAYPQNSMHTTTGHNWKKTASIIFTLVLMLLGTVIGMWWLLVVEGK